MGLGAKRRRKNVPNSAPVLIRELLHDSDIAQEIGGASGDTLLIGLRGHLRPPNTSETLQSDTPLNDAVRCALRRSPHSLQVQEDDYRELLDVRSVHRILRRDATRREYRRRADALKTVVHWGQRKLLLSEIEFLTRNACTRGRVIYAGAAPGTHIKFLVDLFPGLDWTLVDPNAFKITSSDTVHVRQEYFTSELARELGNTMDNQDNDPVLFISDVRTDYTDINDVDKVDKMVADDMARQQEWVRILQPQLAMLKFRLPYASGKTEYLDGEIHLPVWGPPTTTETRLITDGLSTRVYDHTEYEEQMFFFNTVTRIQRYETPMVGHGLDESYDSAAEMAILEGFINHLSNERRASVEAVLGDPDGPPADKSLDPLLVRLFRRIGQECMEEGRCRHLHVSVPKSLREG